MNTVNPLKRPLTVPNDPLKLLVCKICKKDDVVLNLKTCGCLFCDSCDGDSRYNCNSCNSELDQKIKLSFTMNPRCKYYEHNKCYNSAEYKCRCLPNCFVCSSCLNYIHRKKVRGSCVPEMITRGITTNDELCELCKEFYAGFRMTSRPYSKICLDCKTNSNAVCTPIETSVEDADWNQFYREYEQSTKNVSNKIEKIEDELESSSLAREQEIEKCKDAISEIQKCLDKYTIQCDVHILLLNKQLDDLKKISNILKPDGKVKTILDLLKDGKLALHGEQGKEQIINLLNFYREKNDNNPRYPVTEQIKTFFIQNDSSSQHILKFPLPSTPISTDSGVSVRETIENGVQRLILVEKQSAVNERKIILKNIEKHVDKWVRKESFAVNDIVIILDVDATDSHKYKRAKILKLGDDSSEVSLLDFGFQTTVPNSSIGESQQAGESPPVSENGEDQQSGEPPLVSESGEDQQSSVTQTSGNIAAETQVEKVEVVKICIGELKAPFPATIGHYAEIDGELFAHVKYLPYYEKPEMLELHGNYAVVPLDRNNDIGDTVRKNNVTKRGARVWGCPYCKSYSRSGDKHAIIRHMNARVEKDGKRQPGCPIRRRDEPKDKTSQKWPAAKRAPVRLSF